MPKYLIQANYVGEGLKGLLKEGGSSRRAAIEKWFGSVGGRVEAFYYAFGEHRCFRHCWTCRTTSPPRQLSLTVNASCDRHRKVTVLLTPEEIDAAAKKTLAYRPPGQ